MFLFLVIPAWATGPKSAHGHLPIVVISMDKSGIKSLEGLEQEFSNLKATTTDKKRGDKFKSALEKVIGKMGKLVHKAMKLNEEQKGKYALSEVEIGLSLSGEYGLSDVISVGGNSAVILHFVKK